MINKTITFCFSEREYAALCKQSAMAGKELTDLVKSIVQALPSDEHLKKYMCAHAESNFLAYLCQKGKLDIVSGILARMVTYQQKLSEGYAESNKNQTKENLEKIETGWDLIRQQYDEYVSQYPNALPILEEINLVNKWRS